jgi:hypothetical protein
MTIAAPEPSGPLEEHYVAFLESGPISPGAREASPYSVEGCLAGMDAFASGAVRSHGWRRVVARLVAAAILIALLIPCWQGLVDLVDLLLS